jgi:hypothetical protein
MVAVFPGSAKIGISEKLGKTMVSVTARSHGISKAKRPPCDLDGVEAVDVAGSVL